MSTDRAVIDSWLNAKPNYEEFDDVDKSHGSYRISKKAENARRELQREFGLSGMGNPGGAEFNGIVNGKHFRCQVTDSDDVDALCTLRRAIARAFNET